jgi:hypothetical protein
VSRVSLSIGSDMTRVSFPASRQASATKHLCSAFSYTLPPDSRTPPILSTLDIFFCKFKRLICISCRENALQDLASSYDSAPRHSMQAFLGIVTCVDESMLTFLIAQRVRLSTSCRTTMAGSYHRVL